MVIRKLRCGAMQFDLENVALFVNSAPEFIGLGSLNLHGLATDAADWPSWGRRFANIWHIWHVGSERGQMTTKPGSLQGINLACGIGRRSRV